MDDMYREIILDYAQNKRNWGLLNPNDFDHEELNPLCGDQVRLTLRYDASGIIREVGWEGKGCAISQAATSMLSERLIGMPYDEATCIDKQQILDMIGIPLTINRVKCALLPLKVLVVGSLGKRRWEAVEDGE